MENGSSKSDKKKSKAYWRHMKCRVDEICKTLELAEYAQAPDCGQGSLFADALEQLLGRSLSPDDLGCMADRVLINFATLQSTKEKDKARMKTNEQPVEYGYISDGPDSDTPEESQKSTQEQVQELNQLNKPKAKKKNEEVVNLLEDSDSEDVILVNENSMEERRPKNEPILVEEEVQEVSGNSARPKDG